MTEQQMPVYSSDEDRRVARREEQRLQRMATEAAWDVQSDGGPPVEALRRCVYRITVRPAAASARDQPLVRHIFAASGDTAVEHAQAMFSCPGSIYHAGEYRVISIEQILPEPGESF